MPKNESVLVVPLRSNASTLLTGMPIAALRRRLKFASVFYDRLLLETGILRVQAGPTGFSRFIVPPSEQDRPRWQTPAERHAATGVPFAVAVSPDARPDSPPQTVVSSVASISWTATLHPFANELPPGTDWVDFVRSKDPSGEVEKLAEVWNRDDQRNCSLERAIPVKFVRDIVITNANRDLVLAAAAGYSTTVDPFHLQVVAQRFKDDGWGLRGYAIPLLFPQVGDWAWEDIAKLRRDRDMPRFRALLRQVEHEAIEEAASGDIEAAARHAYERHLADEKIEGLSSVTKGAVGGLIIGGAAGLGMAGIAPPWGLVASTLIPTGVGTAIDVRRVIRRRRARGWLSVVHRINSPG